MHLQSILISGILSQAAASCGPLTVLFLPLDERYTTRDAFLNLAQMTGYCILTPSPSLLSSWKTPANPEQLHEWVDQHIGKADAAIISSEMYLYGGLINSRVSNTSTEVLYNRLGTLSDYSKKYKVKLFLSNVVMRIPAYDGDSEEPWYWKNYGRDLFQYSYNQDEYDTTGNVAAQAKARAFKALVPNNTVQEFLWRRERNHNVTLRMLDLQQGDKAPFENLYVTLDDNAKYGFNIREAAQLQSKLSKMAPETQKTIAIYPGADEVQLTLLAKCAVQFERTTPLKLGVVYRDPKSASKIPNYEGQPMSQTLKQQILAAGGSMTVIVESAAQIAKEEMDAVLLVNNFDTEHQMEASQQPQYDGHYGADFTLFDPVLRKVLGQLPVGFCDNRYSNGADKRLIGYMAANANSSRLETIAYAGWNTDGNTIGTAVSNSLLLALFWNKSQSRSANAAFNSLRLVEDFGYQAVVREQLVNYLSTLDATLFPNQNSMSLEPDLAFYVDYSFKQLASVYKQGIQSVYSLPKQWALQEVYYPWNRTFEAGFVLVRTQREPATALAVLV